MAEKERDMLEVKYRRAAEEHRRLKGGDDVDHEAFEAALRASSPQEGNEA